jgi:hypothetical protein
MRLAPWVGVSMQLAPVVRLVFRGRHPCMPNLVTSLLVCCFSCSGPNNPLAILHQLRGKETVRLGIVCQIDSLRE